MTDERAAALQAIAEQVNVCTLCELHKGRTHAVPGAGNIHAEIMFIGEGPGFYEDKQGLPFVGRSGDLLNKMLNLIGINRADVFITNVVKCRPPENRDPLPTEIAACKHYLDAQIDLIDPLLIATLGRFSMARYFPNGKITQIHGKPKFDNARAYYPLFHPAAVLRSEGSLMPQMEADFRRIPEILEQVRKLRAGGALPVGDTPAESPAPEPPTATNEPPKPKQDEPPQQLKLF